MPKAHPGRLSKIVAAVKLAKEKAGSPEGLGFL